LDYLIGVLNIFINSTLLGNKPEKVKKKSSDSLACLNCEVD